MISEELARRLGGSVSDSIDRSLLAEVAQTVQVPEKVGSDLPERVASTSHSRGRSHRPRDKSHTFCSWPWSAAVARGQAVALTSTEQTQMAKCSICERAWLALSEG